MKINVFTIYMLSWSCLLAYLKWSSSLSRQTFSLLDIFWRNKLKWMRHLLNCLILLLWRELSFLSEIALIFIPMFMYLMSLRNILKLNQVHVFVSKWLCILLTTVMTYPSTQYNPNLSNNHLRLPLYQTCLHYQAPNNQHWSLSANTV